MNVPTLKLQTVLETDAIGSRRRVEAQQGGRRRGPFRHAGGYEDCALSHPPTWTRLAGVVAAVLAMALGLAAQTAPDSDAPSADKDRPTVVILGDSLAAGYGLDPSEAFPALLQKWIDEAGWKFSVVNAGVSGDTSAGGLRRIDWLLKRRVDVLVLELGGNDGLRGIPVAATRTNLQAILDRTKQKYPQARIVVAGMQMPPNMGGDYNTAFAKIFPDLATANHAALVPFLLEGVGGKPELNLPDLIHPTAEGHKIVAGNVWKVLRPLLEKSAAARP